MNNKRLASILTILIVLQSLIGPCYCQGRYGRGRGRGRGRGHHHHHDDYRRGGGGLVSGLGTALGIAGAGLLAGAITRGVTRGFGGGGVGYPVPYAQPVVPVAYPATTYPGAGAGYIDPYYAGGIRAGPSYAGSPLVGGAVYGGPSIVGDPVYGGAYPVSSRVRTISDRVYSTVY